MASKGANKAYRMVRRNRCMSGWRLGELLLLRIPVEFRGSLLFVLVYYYSIHRNKTENRVQEKCNALHRKCKYFVRYNATM